jgi:hypothetical protein
MKRECQSSTFVGDTKSARWEVKRGEDEKAMVKVGNKSEMVGTLWWELCKSLQINTLHGR